jgi:hypothetical protein
VVAFELETVADIAFQIMQLHDAPQKNEKEMNRDVERCRQAACALTSRSSFAE